MAVFVLPSGYTLTIDDLGISSVTYEGVSVASGKLQILNDRYFSVNETPTFATIATKSTRTLGDGSVIVAHVYTGVVQARAVYVYRVVGNDIFIKIRVKNYNTRTMEQIAVGSPAFDITVDGSFVFPAEHGLRQGEPYPSTTNKMAACFAAVTSAVGGKPINFAFWPEQNVHDRFGGSIATISGQSLTAIFYRPVLPDHEAILDLVYHFDSSSDWQVMLAGYKTYFRAQLPSLLYTPDARPAAYFSAWDVSNIRENNPYGYNDSGDGVAHPERRFDLDGQPFVDWITPNIIAGGFQGAILWQPQGAHPRGEKYRPDFNSMPPATLANMPDVTAGFAGVSKKIGLLARPSGIITSRGSWTTDRVMPIGDDADYIEDLVASFASAIGNGFTLFYLDSFPASYKEHNVLIAIRDSIAPTVQTFVEQNSILAAAYSAMYGEVSFVADVLRVPAGYTMMRYFWPESIFIVKQQSIHTGGYTPTFTAMLAAKLSPLVEDYIVANNVTGAVTAMASLLPTYVNGSNQWI